ncbi:hypothetical protein QVD17_09438 [Tagetes erecta]|uniref:Uncharacterized protein n=1 Tax=Tagetes erecta TaxID=13708 RepID=A0AAD8P5B1_TARER|nr:hypothetical protein QVD17_09438 [Tagetes erecta]
MKKSSNGVKEEDEGVDYRNVNELEDDGKAYSQDYTLGYVEPERERISMEERIANFNFMRKKEAHYALTTDLIEHCWLTHREVRDLEVLG